MRVASRAGGAVVAVMAVVAVVGTRRTRRRYQGGAKLSQSRLHETGWLGGWVLGGWVHHDGGELDSGPGMQGAVSVDKARWVWTEQRNSRTAE